MVFLDIQNEFWISINMEQIVKRHSIPHCIHIIKDLFNICLSVTYPQDLLGLLGCVLYSSYQRLIQHLFVTGISTRLAMTVGVCTVFTFQRLIQHLFVTNISARLAMTAGVCTVFILFKDLFNICFVSNISTVFAMTVGVCTVFILTKTYSTSVCHQHLHKTCHNCQGLHCIHPPFKDLFNICLSPTFLQYP